MVRRSDNQDENAGSDRYDGPSKSARKRAATAAQELGERLVELSEAQLAALPLPDELRDAIRAARRMRGRGSQARQRQYIGRLMREIDTEPILSQLESATRAQTLDSARFRRVEQWRDRLLDEGDPALAALDEAIPLTDDQRAKLAELLRRARSGGSDARGAAARRELFRELRSIVS